MSDRRKDESQCHGSGRGAKTDDIQRCDKVRRCQIVFMFYFILDRNTERKGDSGARHLPKGGGRRHKKPPARRRATNFLAEEEAPQGGERRARKFSFASEPRVRSRSAKDITASGVNGAGSEVRTPSSSIREREREKEEAEKEKEKHFASDGDGTINHRDTKRAARVLNLHLPTAMEGRSISTTFRHRASEPRVNSEPRKIKDTHAHS